MSLPSLSEIDRLHDESGHPWTMDHEHGNILLRFGPKLPQDADLVAECFEDAQAQLIVALRNAWPAVSEALKAARATLEASYLVQNVGVTVVEDNIGRQLRVLEDALKKIAP